MHYQRILDIFWFLRKICKNHDFSIFCRIFENNVPDGCIIKNYWDIVVSFDIFNKINFQSFWHIYLHVKLCTSSLDINTFHKIWQNSPIFRPPGIKIIFSDPPDTFFESHVSPRSFGLSQPNLGPFLWNIILPMSFSSTTFWNFGNVNIPVIFVILRFFFLRKLILCAWWPVMGVI